jgi:hypothetical protein
MSEWQYKEEKDVRHKRVMKFIGSYMRIRRRRKTYGHFQII